MKKQQTIIRFAVTAAIAAILPSGCGRPPEPQPPQASSEAADIQAGEKIPAETTIENQIKLIAGCADQWAGPTDYGAVYQYTVTDLDQNGRLELIASSLQGTGRYTYSTYYEVNEALDGLTAYTQDYKESDSEADIMVGSVPVYYDSAHNTYHYIFDDTIKDGIALYYDSRRAIVYQNGSIRETMLAKRTTSFMEATPSVACETMDGKPMSEDEYARIADTVFPDYLKMEASFSWYLPGPDVSPDALDKETLTGLLMDCYHGFSIH